MSAAWQPQTWWDEVPWDALCALAEHAVDELALTMEYLHGGTPRSCGHRADPLWVCALHPSLGVTCPDCLAAHLRGRHTTNKSTSATPAAGRGSPWCRYR